jgi:hypothetical protein
MKKISLIFKDDRDADDWLKALHHNLYHPLMRQSRLATIKVSKRQSRKKTP